MEVDASKCHACHTNEQPWHQRGPSAPPEPAQCHECHACHTKWRSIRTPKVPRRVSLGVERNRTDLSDRYSFNPCPPWPVHVIVVICTFCRLVQNRPDALFRSGMSATLARLGVNFGQQGPNFDPLGSNFGPSCSAQLKAKDGQVWPQSAFGWAKYIRPAPFFSVLFFGCGHTRKSIVNPVATPRRPPPALPSWHSWHTARRSWRLGVEPGEGPLMGSVGKYRTMFH